MFSETHENSTHKDSYITCQKIQTSKHPLCFKIKFISMTCHQFNSNNITEKVGGNMLLKNNLEKLNLKDIK